MIKYIKKSLTVLLAILSTASLINVFMMYWLPINILVSSFSVVRLAVVAYIEKRYYLILFSILICVLLFLSMLSVRRNHIALPSLSLLYLIYDFIVVMSLFIDGLDDGYWKTYIIQTSILLVLIVSLCVYLLNFLQYIRGRRRLSQK